MSLADHLEESDPMNLPTYNNNATMATETPFDLHIDPLQDNLDQGMDSLIHINMNHDRHGEQQHVTRNNQHDQGFWPTLNRGGQSNSDSDIQFNFKGSYNDPLWFDHRASISQLCNMIADQDGNGHQEDRESAAARNMLIHAQQESDRIAQRIRTEEDKKKAAELQRQKEKDLKRLAKLEKSNAKCKTPKKHKETREKHRNKHREAN